MGNERKNTFHEYLYLFLCEPPAPLQSSLSSRARTIDAAKCRALVLVLLAWAVGTRQGLHADEGSTLPAPSAQTTAREPGSPTSGHVQIQMEQAQQSADHLSQAMQAYVNGDYAAAMAGFEKARPQLRGQMADAVSLKYGMCCLLTGQSAQAQAIFNDVSTRHAGTGIGKQAQLALNRSRFVESADPVDRRSMLEAVHCLEIGKWQEAEARFSAVAESAKSATVRDYARSESVFLGTNARILRGQYDDTYGYVASELPKFSSKDLAWRALSFAAEAINVHTAGTSREAIMDEVSRLESLVSDHRDLIEDNAVSAVEYESLLADMNIRRMIVANVGVDSSNGSAETWAQSAESHLARAMELATTAPGVPPYYALNMVKDLVDTYLLLGKVEEAEGTLRTYLDRYGNVQGLAAALASMVAAHYNWGNKQRANDWLVELLVRFPDSPEALLAKKTYAQQALVEASVEESLGDALSEPAVAKETAAAENPIETEDLSLATSAPPADTAGSQSARSDSQEENTRPAWGAKHAVNKARYIYWIFAAALGGFISVGVYLINRLLVARKAA